LAINFTRYVRRRRSLEIYLDTDSFNSLIVNNVKTVHRLLLYSKNTTFKFLRSPYNSNYDFLSVIPQIDVPQNSQDLRIIEKIGKQTVKTNLSYGEKGFLLLICLSTGLCYTQNVTNPGRDIENKIFVTENDVFLTNRFSLKPDKLSIESFFPGIKLVNLKEGLEIADIFAKKNDCYYTSPNSKATKRLWYWYYFRLNLPHYNVPNPKTSFMLENDILDAFAKRFLYLLISVDELGKLHYFKKGDDVMVLFHFNYFISLVTGIFDNLAIHTYDKHSIRFRFDNTPSRISLYNKNGGDFLKEVEKVNPRLRNHIRDYKDFIVLIYILREQVIHRQGLKEIGFYLDFKMFPAILIASDIEGLIRICGDRPGPYTILSQWGIYKFSTPEGNKNYYYMNPYYFAKSASHKLMQFADKYLHLEGFTKFVDKLPLTDGFVREMKSFQELSLTTLN
jgi:hypothetical protein